MARLRILRLILFTGMLFHATVSGQTAGNLSNDLEAFWEVQKRQVKAVGNAESTDLLLFSALSASTVLSGFLIDKPVHNMFRQNRSPFLDRLFTIDDYYGDKYITAAGILLIYASGLVADDHQLRDAGMQSIAAYVSSGLVTFILKEMAGRSRPYLDEGTHSFRFLPRERGRRSFPSGHTSATFAVSSVMAAQDNSTLWKTVWLGAAGFVGLSRLYNDQHWFSDVLFGGIIGYATGTFVANNFREDNKNSDPDFNITISVPLLRP